MSEVDFRHIGDLLKVIESTVGHPGKLGAIAKAATDELYAINDELRQEQAEAQKAADEKAAQEAADKQAERDAQTEEQAKAARLQSQTPPPKAIPATDPSLRRN